MSDPHDELHLAAARIREVAGRATPGPWGVGNGTTVARKVEQLSVGRFTCLQAVTDTDMFDGREDWTDGGQGYVDTAPEDDAEHIALFDPVMAGHIATVLSEEADRHYSARPAILALARALNGGAR